MFSKAAFVCLLAVYLVQPSESSSLPGLDAALGTAADIATSANAEAQSAASSATTSLLSLQSFLLNATTSLNPAIAATINSGIASAVTSAGFGQSGIANCVTQYQSALTAFEVRVLNTIVSTCLNLDVSKAISLVSYVSGTANNLTNIVVGLNASLIAACPPAGDGDMVGGIFNAVCSLGVLGVMAGEVAFQAIGLSNSVTQAQDLANSLIAAAPGVQTCVQNQLGSFFNTGEPVIADIIKCASVASAGA